MAFTLLSIQAIVEAGPDIVYKYIDDYDLIARDTGSGAEVDAAVWRIRNNDDDFCALGDIVTADFSYPNYRSVLVSQVKDGALVHPTSFSLLWSSEGSEARYLVTSYRMNAPVGYTCLGDVVMSGLVDIPDPYNYCCVKDEYLVEADTFNSWDDTGMAGVEFDVSTWTVVRAEGEPDGLYAGTFFAVPDFSKPDWTTYLMKRDEDKVVHQSPPGPDIVYKYTEVFDLIWKDSGSGAAMDGAVWRARNDQPEYCSLGDVATGDGDYPDYNAVLVSERKAGSLVQPTSFSLVWNDKGSGAHADVSIYRMTAPSGYTCLGAVAVDSFQTSPDSSKYCCVKDDYLVEADAIHTWNDKGSGADSDVSLWTVVQAEGEFYGLEGGNFIGVQGYSEPNDQTPYILKGDDDKVRHRWTLHHEGKY